MGKPVVALIGAGRMGSSHARIIADAPDADLGVVIDHDRHAAEEVAGRYWARVSTDIEDALAADAVVIATSTATHLECARPFIEAGIPTFVEKPLCADLDSVDELLKLAEHNAVPLMCGFVERFNAAFRTAAAMLDAPPLHVSTIRHSPAAPRIASSVVADLLLHDLDAVLRLFCGEAGQLTGAACHRPANSPYFEIADCSLRFPSGIATLSANRIGQRKIRSITIHSEDQTIEVDLLRQDVTVYRNESQEILREGGGVGYRASTVIDIPFVRHTGEPLALQFAHFLRLVAGLGDPDAERRHIRPPHVLMSAIENGGAIPDDPAG